MWNRGTGMNHLGGLAIVWLLCSSPALAQRPEITIAATQSQKRPLELSDILRVTLTVDGPSPLRVEFPKKRLPNGKEIEQFLADESNRDWKITRVGAATKTPLENDRERWIQGFQLEPFVARGATTILFAPITVNGHAVPGPGCEVIVNPPVIEAKPGAAMTITGIEELPPHPPPVGSSWLWVWVVAVAAVLVVLTAIVWRARRRPMPIQPREWAAAAFAKLESKSMPAGAVVEGIASTVRGFIDRRFGIPATRLTTEELLMATEQAAWSVEQADSLRRLLEECDRAKFAGEIPDDDGCRSLLVRGREWVDLVSTDARPG
jgi:hypothetical protein